MIYPNNFEYKIGFAKIRTLITERCLSELGNELTDRMKFSTDIAEIRANLEATAEFMSLLATGNAFPEDGFADCRSLLKKLSVDGTIPDTEELYDFKRSLELTGDILAFFRLNGSAYPIWAEKSSRIIFFPYISERLNAIIGKNGTIKDNASRELALIRSSIVSKQSGISKRMHAILQYAQSQGWADKDVAPAVRDGRIVIPLPAAHKRKIKGIVHDESATGKTSYIEPEEIVEINNEIRELQIEEKREIQRILKEFADNLRPYIPDLYPTYEFLAAVDFTRAKASFSNSVDCILPLIENKAHMEWHNARHPILQINLKKNGKTLVPLDISLDSRNRILIISGPNAGGKSVCLQTCGLLQYMLQCGIPVPVSRDSVFGIFNNILIDIGDEQSIENDLSTYSSHLINMKNFIQYANKSTLILIDEFGSGTEPMLGGAIAEAVLGALNDKETMGVITTHYANLKHMASQTRGLINGAMMYDSARMSPLFRLEIGKPGSSFAFEIAKKIGLPKDILERASEKIGKEHILFDKHLKDILRDKYYWEKKRDKIHKNEKLLDETLEKYKEELKEIEEVRKNIIREAKIKAQDILSTANRTVENTIRVIRETQAEKEATREIRKKMEEDKKRILEEEAEKEAKIQRKIEKLQNRNSRKKERKEKNDTYPHTENREDFSLKAGDSVSLPNGAIAEVLETNPQNTVVALGDFRSVVKTAELKKLSGNRAKKTVRTRPASYMENFQNKRLNFKPDIDVRGMRGDEALQRVVEFIDEAAILGLKNLRVLHGTGTGALRQIIRDYLRTNPVVLEFKDEHVQMGGAGITVIILDL